MLLRFELGNPWAWAGRDVARARRARRLGIDARMAGLIHRRIGDPCDDAAVDPLVPEPGTVRTGHAVEPRSVDREEIWDRCRPRA
jgi:hypothetical protein